MTERDTQIHAPFIGEEPPIVITVPLLPRIPPPVEPSEQSHQLDELDAIEQALSDIPSNDVVALKQQLQALVEIVRNMIQPQGP